LDFFLLLIQQSCYSLILLGFLLNNLVVFVENLLESVSFILFLNDFLLEALSLLVQVHLELFDLLLVVKDLLIDLLYHGVFLHNLHTQLTHLLFILYLYFLHLVDVVFLEPLQLELFELELIVVLDLLDLLILKLLLERLCLLTKGLTELLQLLVFIPKAFREGSHSFLQLLLLFLIHFVDGVDKLYMLFLGDHQLVLSIVLVLELL